MLTALILLIGVVFKSTYTLRIGLFIGIIAYTIQVLVLFIWMAISSALAILCDPNPFQYFFDYQFNELVSNATRYYTDCSGK